MRSRGEFVLEDGVEHEMAKQLRARLDQLKAQRPKAKLLNPKEALKDSVMRRAYLVLQPAFLRCRASLDHRPKAAHGAN